MKFDINNKLFLKILSGLVALVLWFAITYTEDPIISQHLGDISIAFEGEDDLNDNGLAIINKDDIPGLSAVIRGKRSNVISAMGTVVASCDVSGIQDAGENIVQLKYVYPTATITMAKIKTRYPGRYLVLWQRMRDSICIFAYRAKTNVSTSF